MQKTAPAPLRGRAACRARDRRFVRCARTAAIEDRQKTGPCPMESAVAGIEDIDASIAAIRRRAEELRAGH